MRLYWVDPSTQAVHPDPYYPSGSAQTLPDGTVVILGAASPANNVYEAIEDNTPTPTYYTRAADTLTFVGAVGDLAARVQEMRNFDQIPIADLYAAKKSEIAGQDETVRFNAFDTSLAGAWWVVVDEPRRLEIDDTDSAAQWRRLDGQPWPGGVNQPLVTVYNAGNQNVRREPVPNEAAWITIITEKAQHAQQTGNATKASGDALDAAYADGAGDWQTVADHDPADPAWQYPPTVDAAELSAAMGG